MKIVWEFWIDGGAAPPIRGTVDVDEDTTVNEIEELIRDDLIKAIGDRVTWKKDTGNDG